MQLKYPIFIIISLFLFNCKKNKADIQTSEAEIISLIINEIAIPVPPPPPPSSEAGNNNHNQPLSKEKINSIKSIKLNVGINPELIEYAYPILNTEQYPVHYISLIKEIPVQNNQDLSNLDVRKLTKHNVQFFKWDGKSEMRNFDVLLKFSTIVWSKDQTKAAAIAIRKLGRFDGTTYLFLFEKNPNKEIKIYRKYVLLKS